MSGDFVFVQLLRLICYGNNRGIFDICKENARSPKFRGPHFVLTTIIVMVVLAGGLSLLFHQPAPKHPMNWTILGTIPESQSKQVEDTAIQTIPDGFLVPTKLPFRVQRANATNSASDGSLQIRFSDGKDTVTETVANGLETSSSQVKNIKQINLPHSDSAYTATDKGVLILVWTKNGNTYSLSRVSFVATQTLEGCRWLKSRPNLRCMRGGLTVSDVPFQI